MSTSHDLYGIISKAAGSVAYCTALLAVFTSKIRIEFNL